MCYICTKLYTKVCQLLHTVEIHHSLPGNLVAEADYYRIHDFIGMASKFE